MNFRYISVWIYLNFWWSGFLCDVPEFMIERRCKCLKRDWLLIRTMVILQNQKSHISYSKEPYRDSKEPYVHKYSDSNGEVWNVTEFRKLLAPEYGKRIVRGKQCEGYPFELIWNCNAVHHADSNYNTRVHAAICCNTRVAPECERCVYLGAENSAEEQCTAMHCDALQRTVMHCNALQSTALHCNALHKTATHCIALQRTATRCNVLQRTATHCSALQHTATHIDAHCNTLQRSAAHCMALQRTATHCNTLQRTATHCDALQHTATHYNVLHCTAMHCNALQRTATYCNAVYCTAHHTAPHCNTTATQVHLTTINPKSIYDPIKRNKKNSNLYHQIFWKKRHEKISTSENGSLSASRIHKSSDLFSETS